MFGKAVPKKNLIYNKKFIILPRLLITTDRNEKELKKKYGIFTNTSVHRAPPGNHAVLPRRRHTHLLPLQE
jgi:hypothetical protein